SWTRGCLTSNGPGRRTESIKCWTRSGPLSRTGSSWPYSSGPTRWNRWTREEEAAHLRACWHHLRSVESWARLSRYPLVYKSPSGLKLIKLDEERFRKVMAEERTGWLDFIRDLQTSQ